MLCKLSDESKYFKWKYNASAAPIKSNDTWEDFKKRHPHGS